MIEISEVTAAQKAEWGNAAYVHPTNERHHRKAGATR